MRRKDKAMPNSDMIGLLQHGEYGILSTVDGSGQPYGVPLNYVMMNNCIYFHCALEGHKLDNLAANPRVSFCVVGRTKVLPAEFSTEFESVVVFGRALVIDGEERYRALNGLIEKYSPDFIAEGAAYIEKFDSQTCVVRVEIDRMSGKSKISP
jgi:nitroimidazol reductase NimA-like FMN-containing flavoprotein (pyridoxamine 5'-phosphate oxidase superfamily)